MKQFLVLYHAPTAVQQAASQMSPDEQRAKMGPWMAWMARAGDALVDGRVFMGPGTETGASGSAQVASEIIG